MADFLWRVTAKIIQGVLEAKARCSKPLGTVLMLHSVGAPEPSEFNVSEQAFERLLKNLSGRRCIRLEEWESAESGFYALTFDDVPQNFYTVAYPLLRRYGVPFTIFINRECMDSEGYLTSGQVKEISRCPLCTIGSHGCSHDFYRRLSHDGRENDLRQSRDALRSIAGRDVELFAFPYGSVFACGLTDISLVSSFYRYGFSTLRAHVTRRADRNFIPRVCVTESHPLCR